MKILVNGNTVGELIFSKNSKEEISITKEDVLIFDRVLGHIKRNKKMYLKLVILVAITMNKSTLTSLAMSDNLEIKLNEMSSSILDKLILVAKFGSLGMGVKEWIVTTLNGGSMKEATMDGMRYWLGYIFLQLYPSLYDLADGFKF